MAVYNSAADICGDGKYLPAVTNPADLETIETICAAASRVIDHYTGRGADAFDPAKVAVAESRIFYGRGTNAIWLSKWRISDFLPESLTIPAGVTLPAGYSVPHFILDARAPRLLAVNESGMKHKSYFWPEDMPVTVTAKWGFAEIPQDIRAAHAQIVVRFWRGKDESFSGVIGRINSDQSIVEKELPVTARMILDLYAETRPTIA